MPLITKEFEKNILECLKEAVNESAPDLFNDIVEENPEFWADQLKTLFNKQMRLALQDRRLIKEILKELIAEDYPIEDIIRDILKERGRKK